MRVFLATLLNPSNQRACRQCLDVLTAGHARALRAVPDGSAHLTYAFSANLRDVAIDALVGTVGRVAAGVAPFDVRFDRLRIIASGSQPRLVSLEVGAGADSLSRLADGLATAVGREHPRVDLKPTRSPHVTLARFRKQAGKADARAVAGTLAALTGLPVGAVERIDRVEIVESRLTPAGPEYTVLSRVELSPTAGAC